jgi:putative tryptophan/tyrosine transport system ATP-binding protein
MLRVIDVKKSFENKEILKGISFDAHLREVTILEGDNGAGKSTLFNIIAGLQKEDSGKISLLDVDLSSMSAIARAEYISLLKQDPKTSSVSSFSILDNFALALLKGKKASIKKASSKDVRKIVVDHFTNLKIDMEIEFLRPMETLSGGQRQILAFLMATINKPSLLLLDEPTAALDEKYSHILMSLVKRLTKAWDIPAVMISHNQKLNRQYGDVIFHLRDGKIDS